MQGRGCGVDVGMWPGAVAVAGGMWPVWPCPHAVAVTTGSGWGFQVAGRGPAPVAALLRWEPQDKASTLAFPLLNY